MWGKKYLLFYPLLRARYEPGLPFRTPIFRNYLRKQAQFHTLFPETPV
jgi:hypothetical protein